jgi:hypothetical protein
LQAVVVAIDQIDASPSNSRNGEREICMSVACAMLQLVLRALTVEESNTQLQKLIAGAVIAACLLPHLRGTEECLIDCEDSVGAMQAVR